MHATLPLDNIWSMTQSAPADAVLSRCKLAAMTLNSRYVAISPSSCIFIIACFLAFKRAFNCEILTYTHIRKATNVHTSQLARL